MKFLPLAYIVGSLLFAASSTISQPALAAVNLLVNIETHNTASKTVSNIPPDSNESLEVTLDDWIISVKSTKETTIFDFKTQHRFVLDNTAKSYVIYSLYDTVGFRTLEFKNREMLHGALAAAKVTSASMTTAENENIFSIQSRSPAKIDEAIKKDDLVFSSNDHQLARWSRKGFDVTVADAERFAKFLRYNQGGHPIVLSKLAAGNLIPNRMSFTFTQIGWTSNRSISIKALHQIESKSNDLSSYSIRQTPATTNKFDNILDQASSLKPEAIEKAQTLNRNSVEKAFHDGRVLDAILELLEWTLMTGQQVPTFSPEQLTKIRGDSSAQKFVAASNPKSKEDIAVAIKALVDLRSQAPKKSYVLKIFEANNRIRLGELNAANNLFMEVLQNNLLLAGVYKDLGDLFLTQYDTPRAWRCWDIGRRLAPQFGNFAAVTQFEKTLATQHPEYF